MDTSRTIAEEWSKVTGVALTQGWGLTECSPGVCINPPDADFNGSVGVPMPSTQVLVIGEDGAEVAAGQIGELCVKGPQVMSGYWKQAELTAQAFTADGWLRTGDLGRMDERGFVFIVDRLSDVINVSGFKVYPNEVEAVATERPDVAQAAAVAEIDERGDEKVALYVVPAAKEVDVDALLKHCRESLAPYKVPRQVHVRTELPMSNVGKVLRKFLRPTPTVPAALG
jgi:long-chain acyl-CoA synthetase